MPTIRQLALQVTRIDPDKWPAVLPAPAVHRHHVELELGARRPQPLQDVHCLDPTGRDKRDESAECPHLARVGAWSALRRKRG
ncbi:MAG: hypothetical protein ACRDTT_14365 [Pseudonocardiaceae bacterium]